MALIGRVMTVCRGHRVAVAIALGAAALLLAACATLMPPGVFGRSNETARESSRESAGSGGSGRSGGSGGSGGGVLLAGTARAGGEPALRIRLLTAVDAVEIAGPVTLTVGLEGRELSTRGVVATPFSVSRTEAAWLIRDGSGKPLRAVATPTHAERSLGLEIEPATGSVGSVAMRLNGKPYPGTVVLLPSSGNGAATGAAEPVSGGVFDVVERVPIEEYLPGVVAKELIAGWSEGAFKAQAIAARSYALHERARAQRVGRRFDLESSEMDQAYDGVTVNRTAQRAVEETRGVVLTHGGEVLRAYYSSTCGGRSNAARSVWPTGPGFEFNLAEPLQGTAGECAWCTKSPLHRWTVERDPADLVSRLSAYGRDNRFAIREITSVTRMTPSLFGANGRPSQFRIFDAQGRWWALSAEETRVACNWRGSSGKPAVTREERVNSGDFEARLEGGKVRFTGRGFGHGVGMCQYGAEGMSRDGRTAEEILRFAYPDAVLQRAY